MGNEIPGAVAQDRNRLAVKAATVVLLFVAVGMALHLKEGKGQAGSDSAASAEVSNSAALPPSGHEASAPSAAAATVLPRLVDLGAGKCIPCKMMAPILAQLKEDFAGRFEVQFIDVWENPDAGEDYGIQIIPTQIFYDTAGKEQFRHEGFFSREDILAQWMKLGVELGDGEPLEFSRLEPAAPDTRAKDSICYMCDGDIDPKTRAILKTEKGDVAFCSPHCYFIAYSSMVDNKPAVESVAVTDWSAGTPVAAASASFVYGVGVDNRPTIKAFGDAAVATAEQQTAGGNVLEWAALQSKELATSCGFCDRAVYPEDACAVKVEGLNTRGCCTMCALGVAARMQKDIHVAAKDALTGDAIATETLEGHVALLDPPSAVAWAGTTKDAEGKLVSTGCFKQAFFVNEANLRTWVDAHPTATGRMITIEQALAEKMKLTPQQISKACKIGECAPK
ncbi:MAG: nitrous oxide reductase accessory protein NosL [Candidatus Hydrogenedentes bacterium]|nr:nitrous oxide reductase accessory protein NosL [Candidatus Hydrogenedentota bacterium]